MSPIEHTSLEHVKSRKDESPSGGDSQDIPLVSPVLAATARTATTA